VTRKGDETTKMSKEGKEREKKKAARD